MPARQPLLLTGLAAALVIASIALFASRPRIAEQPAQAQAELPRETKKAPPPAGLAIASEPAEAPTDRSSIEGSSPSDAPREAIAVIAVRIVARETGAPLGGVRIRLFEDRRELPPACAGRGLSTITMLATDADGYADCAAPSGKHLSVRTGDLPWKIGPRNVELETPGPGERVELVIEVPTVWSLSFFGRVLDPDGAPIPKARAVVDSGLGRYADGRFPRTEHRLFEARSEADGLFELRLPDWDAHAVVVDAPGWSPAIVAADDVHASPDAAREVRLQRAATLVVRASDPHGPRAGIEIVLETRGQALEPAGATTRASTSMTTFRWSATTGARGDVVLEDLPSRVSLALRVQDGTRTLPVPVPALALEPGERRELEITVDPARAVRGRVVLDGKPLAKSKVWRIVPVGDRKRSLAFYERREQEVESDGEGRFTFEDVPPGTWWITLPAPAGNDARAKVSLPVEVVVVPGVDPPEVLLEATSGTTIRGRVLDPKSAPAMDMLVVASREDPKEMRVAHTDEEGSFEVGPLDRGEFQLVAIDPHSKLAPSAYVIAKGGASEVLLRLRLGITLAGRVVDAGTREPCEAEIELIRANEQGHGQYTAATREGRFESTGILAGTYSITAKTEDGRFGYVAGVVAEEGARREVEIAVIAGARLSLATQSAEQVSVEAWFEGACVATETVTKPQPANLVVPVGAVTVRWRRGSNVGEKEITVAAGAPSVLEIGP
jgi:hypothetical protein